MPTPSELGFDYNIQSFNEHYASLVKQEIGFFNRQQQEISKIVTQLAEETQQLDRQAQGLTLQVVQEQSKRTKDAVLTGVAGVALHTIGKKTNNPVVSTVGDAMTIGAAITAITNGSIETEQKQLLSKQEDVVSQMRVLQKQHDILCNKINQLTELQEKIKLFLSQYSSASKDFFSKQQNDLSEQIGLFRKSYVGLPSAIYLRLNILEVLSTSMTDWKSYCQLAKALWIVLFEHIHDQTSSIHVAFVQLIGSALQGMHVGELDKEGDHQPLDKKEEPASILAMEMQRLYQLYLCLKKYWVVEKYWGVIPHGEILEQFFMTALDESLYSQYPILKQQIAQHIQFFAAQLFAQAVACSMKNQLNFQVAMEQLVQKRLLEHPYQAEAWYNHPKARSNQTIRDCLLFSGYMLVLTVGWSLFIIITSLPFLDLMTFLLIGIVLPLGVSASALVGAAIFYGIQLAANYLYEQNQQAAFCQQYLDSVSSTVLSSAGSSLALTENPARTQQSVFFAGSLLPQNAAVPLAQDAVVSAEKNNYRQR